MLMINWRRQTDIMEEYKNKFTLFQIITDNLYYYYKSHFNSKYFEYGWIQAF